MAKKKLKKFLKKAAKAALIGGALYAGAKGLKGLGRKRATDAPGNALAKAKRLMTSDAAYGKAPYMDAIRRSQKLTSPNIDPGPSLAAKGGRIGKKGGGRTGKQFGGGLNRRVARPIGGVGGVGAPVRPLAYKHGGKVKSMGVAKRGGGIAKR